MIDATSQKSCSGYDDIMGRLTVPRIMALFVSTGIRSTLSNYQDLAAQASTASASSYYSGLPPALAVDGNLIDPYCFATDCGQQGPQWWQIDLGATYNLMKVHITPPRCCVTRINGLKVYLDGIACATNVQIGDYGIQDSGCGGNCDAGLASHAMDISCEASGRILKLERAGDSFGCNHLELCQVAVSGTLQPEEDEPEQDGALLELTGTTPKIAFGPASSPVCSLSLNTTASHIVSTCNLITPSDGRRLEGLVEEVSRKEHEALKAKFKELEAEVADIRNIMREQVVSRERN